MKKLILLLAVFFLFSCKKDREPPPTKIDKQQLGNNYRISLKSTPELNALLSEIQTKGRPAIARFEKQGFIPAIELRDKSIRRQQSVANTEMPPPNKYIPVSGDPEEAFKDPSFLFPDEDIALLFNVQNEIDVEDVVYKVTSWGTFATLKSNYNDLLSTLSLYADDPEGAAAYYYREPVTEGYFKVKEGIYLVDTFDKRNKSRQLTSTETHMVLTEGNFSPVVVPEPVFNTSVQNKLYDNLPLVKYGKDTFLGKLFSLFGNNEVYTEKFNSSRRVKVSLFNTNYLIVKKLGIQVSLQKKNWIGWSDTEAEELRLGWDALSFTVKDNTIPADPWVPIKNSFASRNPDWDKTAPPFVKPDAIKQEIDLLGFNYSLDISNGVRQGVKQLYDFMKSKAYSSIKPNEASTINVWRDAARTSVVKLATPCEMVTHNQKRIRIEFHRQTDVIISFSGIAKGDWTKAIWKSANASRKATTVTLDLASIYGVAKVGGTWKGARIEKN